MSALVWIYGGYADEELPDFNCRDSCQSIRSTTALRLLQHLILRLNSSTH